MKKTLITLACAAVAPLAFAQTSTTTTETSKTAPVSGTSTTTTTAAGDGSSTTSTSVQTTEGTVSTFTPGKTIVVRRTGVTDPISYTIGKTVTYVNKAGKTIEASMIKPGVPVHVYYSGPESSRTVTKVEVDQ